MALASFRKICLDAVDPERVGPFWASVLDLTWVPDDRPPAEREGGLYGAERRPLLWINRATGPKQTKHRWHFDVYAESLDDLTALGARVLLPEGEDRRWTIMADLEDGEFCAFLRSPVPAPRLHGIVVDALDHALVARFWHEVLGGSLVDQISGYSTVENIVGLDLTLDIVPVTEPKTAPNRIHLDLTAPSPQPLLDAGATLLRQPDDEIDWHVLADPEGNEFCLFAD